MSCTRQQVSFMSRRDGDKWVHSITAVANDADSTILCDSFESDKPLSLVGHMRHWGVLYQLDNTSHLGELFNKPLSV